MTETSMIASPVTPMDSADLAVSIEEVFPIGQIVLRADNAGVCANAVKTVIGLEMPETRKFSGDGERRLWWMSPDEWLLTCGYDEAATLEAALEEALSALPHAVVDVSDARTVFRISGNGAGTIIQKGSPIDLHPDRFAPGDVRRTHCAEIACAYAMTDDDPQTFEMVVFRSYAAHIQRWLCTAAARDSMTEL